MWVYYCIFAIEAMEAYEKQNLHRGKCGQLGEKLELKKSGMEQQGKEWTGTGTFSPNDSW